MKEKEISKYISLILRHKPEVIGITLDEHGWADVKELIDGIRKTTDFDMPKLEKIVAEDEKQRYSFNEDRTLIRANQGHSIPVDVELEQKDPPAVPWHGTGEKFTAAIDAEGLIPKSRLYVHLSSDQETARKVGTRHGRPVIYQVDAESMNNNGYEFFLSANGVWLTKAVPTQYLSKQMMIDNEIRGILSRRKALHPEDSFATEECWKEEITVLSRDIEQTIDFFLNRCTGEEFAWLSEVFEDVLEITHSKELRRCLCTVARKYPEETQEYNILSFITNEE